MGWEGFTNGKSKTSSPLIVIFNIIPPVRLNASDMEHGPVWSSLLSMFSTACGCLRIWRNQLEVPEKRGTKNGGGKLDKEKYGAMLALQG